MKINSLNCIQCGGQLYLNKDNNYSCRYCDSIFLKAVEDNVICKISPHTMKNGEPYYLQDIYTKNKKVMNKLVNELLHRGFVEFGEGEAYRSYYSDGRGLTEPIYMIRLPLRDYNFTVSAKDDNSRCF